MVKEDAIARSDAARRQSAGKAFGRDRKAFVSPRFFVKDECRASWPGLRLMRQSTHWSHFHWLVSRCRYETTKSNRLRYCAISATEKVAIVGARPHTRRRAG